MGRKKSKKEQEIIKIQDELFDVKKNLKKLRRGKGDFNYIGTDTDFNTNNADEKTSINNVDNTDIKTGGNIGTIMQLKDSIHSESKEIRTHVNNIHSELLKDKLSKNLFWTIITGLISILMAFALMFYYISYDKYLNKVEDNRERIIHLEK